jgi:L-ascorbate metabolism protein UlaG (beta-lactamase superfamily)
MEGTRIYHAGDTDNIPEMKDIKVDVALLPVSGTYVMTPTEAIEAAEIIKPQLAIPMHWGTNLGGGRMLGSKADAEEFQKGVSCKVEIPRLD